MFKKFLYNYSILKTFFHKHKWERTNDVDVEDVPDEYPPLNCGYSFPRRRCKTCGKSQMLVGPEICGGSKKRWI